jgi:GGDEF domain-containing protein
MIQFCGKLLSSAVVNEIDFVGHIGGDDFILIFQSEDWEARCVKILDTLKQTMPDFYDVGDRKNGIVSEDRQGKKVGYPLVTMSVGVVKIEPAMFTSHHEVSAAIASAKKQAKAFPGNSLFLERRMQATAHAVPESC